MNRKETKKKLDELDFMSFSQGCDYIRSHFNEDAIDKREPAIETTKQEILDALRFWVPVSEGLPKTGHDQFGYLEVFVKTQSGDNFICCHVKGNTGFSWIVEPAFEYLFELENVTHYAYIPEVTE